VVHFVLELKLESGQHLGITQEVGYWLSPDMGSTPTSTTLHPSFLPFLHSKGVYLDVGCGPGRISRELGKSGIRVIGAEPNMNDLVSAQHFDQIGDNKYTNEYIQAFGEALPFRSASFDGAFLLATLGAVDRKTREDILVDTLRCLRPGAPLYIAEFARIKDAEAYTSDGKRWIEVYQKDSQLVGEYGSVIVHNKNGSTRFIGHHFTEEELIGLLVEHGVAVSNVEHVQINSSVSGQARDSLNIWGRKSEKALKARTTELL